MAERTNVEMVTLRNADILRGSWRNFAGQKGPYNDEGKRSFHVRLPDDVAREMERDGFNIKELRARDEDEEPGFRVEIAVSYKIRPPQVFLISGGVRTLLDEGSVEILDYVDIAKADLIIQPSFWEVNGKTGLKAYLHKLYVTARTDELDEEYASIPLGHSQSAEIPEF
ncbi:MAG: hypothetical protein BWY50_02031 [Spirochaetes bacterium ADurb.Bin315]|nr:MAG: hypothetical protein BWY50_02031 [Spirochaetes bacterium ADurb.Bin315]